MGPESHDTEHVERLLRAFEPHPPTVSRDRVMYEAGCAAQGRRQRRMTAVSWGLTCAASVGLVISLWMRPEPERVVVYGYAYGDARPERPIEVPDGGGATEEGDSVSPVRTNDRSGDERPSFLRLRNRALALGVDALPLPEAREASRVAEAVPGELWSGADPGRVSRVGGGLRPARPLGTL